MARRGTVGVLTRHFVSAILQPPILTDLGSDYLRRTVAGLVAILIVLGIFLPRAFFYRYTMLHALVQREPYYRAVQADSLMMIAIPMLIIGIAAVVLCPLLFPDETDYRVLTPLPVTRRQLFGAKLLAVVIVVVIGVLAISLISSVWFPIAVGGRRAIHPAMLRIGSHAVATILGSLWMASAVMAIQGATLTLLPRAWQRSGGLVVQAVLLVGLLMSIPLVTRMPAMMVAQDTVMSAPLVWLPPAWFLGVERWLLDGRIAGGYVDAARIAAVAFGLTLGAIAGAYFRLFLSAEQLAGMAGADRGRRTSGGSWLRRLPSPTAATVSFIGHGLARSRLHQFIVLMVVAAGVALLAGQIANVIEGATPFASRPRAAINAAIAAPLTLALALLLGLRSAFLMPLDRPASWMFRTTEDPATRAAMLDGVVLVVALATVGVPLIVAAALQPAVLGGTWWVTATLTALVTLIMTEAMLGNWQRLPFACTYLPGKRVLAYSIGVVLACYFVIVVAGGNLIRWGSLHPSRTLAVGGALLAAWAWLRRSRLETWGQLELEFEDYDPAEVRKLGFVPD